MSEPKYHHYVPKFYLSRFTDEKGKLWVFDKEKENIFSLTPENIGGQKQFYRLDELKENGLDPLTLEKQFADLESEISNITKDWFRQFTHSDTLIIPEINRELVSLFITTQLLRTVEAREQLIQFVKITVKDYNPEEDANNLHAALLWDESLINSIKKRISDCIWLFGKNESIEPFCTSDHPVTIKTLDNKQWITGPKVFEEGMYIVFPLTPTLVMYCKDPKHWEFIRCFENSISPVPFSTDMVHHENSGQIGMSYRFIFSNNSDFSFAKEFLNEQSEFKDSNRRRF